MNFQKMLDAAESAYPNECCGLLSGIRIADKSCKISRVVHSRNVHPLGGKDRFEVDPQIRFNLMRELGEIGEMPDGPEHLIGHYHSHPDHPVTPSEHDLACAFEPELFWIIIGLENGTVKQVGAFKLDGSTNHFSQIPLRQTNGKTYPVAPDLN